MPLVSILIPVYNRAHLVKEAIDSALAQTLVDLEVVIVDNCSTDGTREVLEEYAVKDDRVRIYFNETNVGPVRNWIRAVKESRAEYCKILFSDDLIHPLFLEKTLPNLIDPSCSLVYVPSVVGVSPWVGGVHYRAFVGNAKIARDWFVRISTHMEHLTPVSPGAALFRKQDLLRNTLLGLDGIDGFDFAGTGAGVDWLIYQLTALQYEHVAYVDQPLAFFRAHAGSISISDSSGVLAVGYSTAKSWLKSRIAGL
jgi:glycosyltransferase involved in cell wall biosynthesis